MADGFEFTLDVGEVAEYAQRLEAAADDISLAARGITNTYAEAIVQEARRRVHVITGRLRGSIHITRTSSSGALAIADVAADAPYAGYEEFGTVHRPPHPYMRPAVDKYRKPYRDAIAEVARSMALPKGVPGAPRRFGKSSAVRAAEFRSY